MVSDSIINASIPNASKDFAKKKRPNRSAKLKQCKLDARREQWLSQVKNKSCKEDVNAPPPSVGGKFNGPSIETRKKATQCCKDLQLQSSVREEEINHHDSDSESSPTNSPTSSVSRGNDSANTYTGSSSSSSSSSSFSSGGCCSGSMTEEEEGEGGDGGCGNDDCLDDWEAVADALVGATDDNQGHNSNPCLSSNQETSAELNCGAQSLGCNDNVDLDKSDEVGILGNGTDNCRAWRPDDAFRPQSLPNLAKQRSFPTGPERHHEFTANPWVRNNMAPRVPTSCPICCEDLDLTDSSFLPCPCGFHLCLFCHKRILEEDGRCPGCRKMYASDLSEKEANVSGGSLTIRLARSCSMSSSRV